MKKLFAILLVVMMTLALAAPAFAAGGTGSITVTGTNAEGVYSIYKLLDLESYNTTSGAYSYKVNSNWAGFFATTEALTYVAIDGDGYVTWTAAEDDTTIANFAKAALAYAKAHPSVPVVKTTNNPGDFTKDGTTIKFSGLDLGYYLIDSTMGALCGLTTTNPDGVINAKNFTPTIDKQVKEDSTDQWGDSNTADIGQTVEFRVTINVHPGAENYALHDVMSNGLTFKQVSKIEHIKTSESVTDTLTKDTEYSVWTKAGFTSETTDDVSDTCTFEVRFTKSFCDTLKANDKVIVYYEAMLNRNAIVANDGNPNEAWLEYGEDHSSTHDTTTTKTFGFDIIKTDSQNTLIDGAKFKIYDAATGGNEVKVVLMDDHVTYRRAREDEPGVEIVVEDGKVRVVGFDNGTYYLEETVSPEGYNKLTARKDFTIADKNLDAKFELGIYSTGTGVHVVNKTGNMLPETGGFGSTMFFTLGGLVVLACGVLLFAKKRMSQIAE